MANVAHSSLTGANLHEPKGVATATVDQVYQADGAGSGAWKLPIKKYSITLTPTIVASNTTSEQTFTCSGLVLATDKIIGVSKAAHQAGLGVVGWRVSADNTIAITWMNNTGVGITPTAAQVYTVFAHRE
ncbi:hypothetical protein UFOVP1528_44 [uncultured Caudovirales phage]|uniref:Uncharacterized protein n=1 Tax=uncultured Caudovirales phage TaxID=2100421 RepID=A0A6J5PLJ8_9CAUD|nr:hypothetical protein UFOVP905_31 [uncultured Caudovirales phage]CAB4182730.1 hypothetical protein UFOVP1080_19 [uncultured Caudovirales phage]CAB4197222.1 hypothetical protein UFOVP1321_7 [uncultured Caudovirales phage]CAB4212340.1 hypothetical protein UFOVP1432_8 [uncultured Caudovirales phage]CAB5227487.1 hypothetical protein UFOVP1528_44 [uncultured Caudovirales phage]